MKFKYTIAAVAAIAFLGACTVEKTYVTPTTEASVETVPEETNIEDMTRAEKEDLFISYLYTEPQASWMIDQNGEAWMIDFGYTMCQAIDEGMTLEGLAAMTVQAGADPTAVGLIGGAAITLFCPENQWFIDQAA